jgi:hypothetical protein
MFQFNNPDRKEFKEKYQKIIDWYHSKNIWEDKVKVKFSEPVEVVKRQKRITGTEFTLKFFDSVQGSFCYAFNKRTGYPVPYQMINNIVSMEPIEQKNEEDEKDKLIKSILNSTHENIWNYDGYEELLRNSYSSLKKRSLTSIIPQYVREQIKNAMDNKKDYSWSQCGQKRDYSISVKFDDGVGRAWFSSEYSGCGNGDYYILINPTTATLKETD